MLKALYDEEHLREIHLNRIIRETTEEVTEKVTTEVTEKVTAEVTEKVTTEVTEKVTAEVTEKVTTEVTEKVTTEVTEAVTSEVTDTHIRSAVKVFRGMDMSSEEITAKLMEMFGIDKKQAAEYAE